MGPKRAAPFRSADATQKTVKKPKVGGSGDKMTRGTKGGRNESIIAPAPSTDPQPIPTAAAFLEQAKPMHLKLYRGSKSSTSFERDLIYVLDANPKKMSTGSYGWSASGKTKIRVGAEGEEVEVPVQISINIVVPGSKGAKDGEEGEGEEGEE